ncbi:MAG: lysophospholipid acyltransferase family protein [Pseudomonadota bacterium]
MSDASVPTNKTWDADIELPAARSNRQLTIGKRIEAFFFLGTLKLLKLLSIEQAADVMGRLLRIIGPFVSVVHRRGDANLRLIYPEMTGAERSAILRDIWDNLGRTTAEYAHLGELPNRITIENLEVMEPYAQGKAQAVFVSGHFANWEALGVTLKTAGIQGATVYRAPNNRLVDEHIIGLRAEHIGRLQIPKGKRGGRQLLQALNDGYCLQMLVDQKLNDGIEVPLLGHPAMTAPAAARLAKKYSLPIIPIQITRRPGSRFVATVHQPIDTSKESVEGLTEQVNDILGSFILARPDQWLWFHRRWPADITPS